MKRLILLSAPLATYAQNQCYSCSATGGMFSAADSAQNCWYIDGVYSDDITALVGTDLTANTANMVTCADSTSACYTRVKSVDGYPTEIERGCTSGAVSNAAGTQIINAQEITSATATTRCLVNAKTDSSSTTFTSGTPYGVWTANQDTQNLVEVDCAELCAPGTAACNSGNYAYYMDNCDGKCGTAGTCNIFTGQCEWNCNTPSNYVSGQFLQYPGPVSADTTSADFYKYQCRTYTCDGCTTECYGNGAESTDTARTGTCASATTTTTVTTTTAAASNFATDRQCYQCTSDTTSGTACATGSGLTATYCPANGMKCAASSTMWINTDGESVREVVERGCTTDAEAYDTCEFSSIDTNLQTIDAGNTLGGTSVIDLSKLTIATCRYVVSGLNSDFPDGVDARANTYTCDVGVGCSGIENCKQYTTLAAFNGLSYTQTTGCNSCKTQLKYAQHLRNDGTYERAIVHYERMCLTDSTAASNQCTSSDVATDLVDADMTNMGLNNLHTAVKIMTCENVCMADSCHGLRWPGQPMCYSCTGTDPTSSTCYRNFASSTPSVCANYYDNTCMITQTGLDLSSNWATNARNDYYANQVMGAPTSISRGCTYSETTGYSGSAYASRTTGTNQNLYMNRMFMCQTDGCNFGTALPSEGDTA
jgi:hypothetical protein